VVSPLSGSLAKTVYKSFKSIFLDATLTRDGANSGDAYDPTTATATVYTCKAIAQDYGTGADGTALEGASDTMVLILAKSLPDGVRPQSLDRIAIASQGISGVVASDGRRGLEPVTSDPARATWQCRVVT
jgi:hypothetical protein